MAAHARSRGLRGPGRGVSHRGCVPSLAADCRRGTGRERRGRRRRSSVRSARGGRRVCDRGHRRARNARSGDLRERIDRGCHGSPSRAASGREPADWRCRCRRSGRILPPDVRCHRRGRGRQSRPGCCSRTARSALISSTAPLRPTTPLQIQVNVPVEGSPMIVDLTSGAGQRAAGYRREGATVRDRGAADRQADADRLQRRRQREMRSRRERRSAPRVR